MPTDDSSKTEGRKCETNSSVIERDGQVEVKDTACGSASPKEMYADFDPEVVQIKARKAEVSYSGAIPLPPSLANSFTLNGNNEI